MSSVSRKKAKRSIKSTRRQISADPYANQGRSKRSKLYHYGTLETQSNYSKESGSENHVFLVANLESKSVSFDDQDPLGSAMKMTLPEPIYDLIGIKLHQVDIPLHDETPVLPYLPRTRRLDVAGGIQQPDYWQFRGNRSYMQDLRSDLYDTTTPVFSVEFRMRAHRGHGYHHTIIKTSISSYFMDIGALYKSGDDYFTMFARVRHNNAILTTPFTNPPQIHFNSWHHVLLEHTATTISLYLDGVLYTTGTRSTALTTGFNFSSGLFVGEDYQGVELTNLDMDVEKSTFRYWNVQRTLDPNWIAEEEKAVPLTRAGLVTQNLDTDARMINGVTTTPWTLGGSTNPVSVGFSPSIHERMLVHYQLEFSLGYTDASNHSQTYSRIVNLFPLEHYDGFDNLPEEEEEASLFDEISLRDLHIRIVNQIRAGLEDNASRFFERSTGTTNNNSVTEFGSNHNIWPFVEPRTSQICFSVRPHPKVRWWSIRPVDIEDHNYLPLAPALHLKPCMNILPYLGFEHQVYTSSRGDRYGWINRNYKKNKNNFLPSDYVVRGDSKRLFQKDIFLKIDFEGGSNANAGTAEINTGLSNLITKINATQKDETEPYREQRWLPLDEGVVELEYPIPLVRSMTLTWVHRDGTPVDFRGKHGSYVIECISL